MYFYIKNIPLFRGSYLITDVSHSIKTNGVETTFTGTRIPAESLPNPSDSFLASYRPLFDRLVGRARAIVDEQNRPQLSGTSVTLIDGQGGSYTTDPGTIRFEGEKILKESGITNYGVPFNGAADETYIQKIKYKTSPDSAYGGNEWLRAVAIMMGGVNYPIADNRAMNVASNLTYAHEGDVRILTWLDVKYLTTQSFYSTKFIMNGSTPEKFVSADAIIHDFTRTEFYNPRLENTEFKGITVIENNIDFDNNVYQGPINVGPAIDGYGIALSPKLMQRLGLRDGQVVYFRMS